MTDQDQDQIFEHFKIKSEYSKKDISISVAAGDTIDIKIGKLRIKGKVFALEDADTNATTTN